MNAHEGIMFLQAEIRKERIHSVRRNELESLLQGKMTKQIQKENRFHRAASAASAPNGHQKAETVSA